MYLSWLYGHCLQSLTTLLPGSLLVCPFDVFCLCLTQASACHWPLLTVKWLFVFFYCDCWWGNLIGATSQLRARFWSRKTCLSLPVFVLICWRFKCSSSVTFLLRFFFFFFFFCQSLQLCTFYLAIVCTSASQSSVGGLWCCASWLLPFLDNSKLLRSINCVLWCPVLA